MTTAPRQQARPPRTGRPRAGGRRRRRAGSGRSGGSWTPWLPLALVVAAALFGVAFIADGTERRELAGSCTVPGSDLALTSEQAGSAATIAAVGRARGLPERAVVVALATAQQESRLRNLDYGDRDSLGLFQQRPSQGWGTEEQVQDPVYAAGQFYDGLVEVPGWQEARVTDAAQAVQLSGFPEAYQQWTGMAEVLTAALAADAPVALRCSFEPVAGDGRLSERTAEVAATAERELGVPATEEFGAVAVDAAAGWPAVTWAVARAEGLGVDRVAFDGWTWTPDGGWVESAAGADAVRLELAG